MEDKIRYLVFSIIFFSITTMGAGRTPSAHRKKYPKSERKFVFGYHPAGFFSLFMGVLNNIAWCERNNYIPVVYWGPGIFYYHPEGYNGSYNCWEYYFEPVSHATYNSSDRVHDGYWPPDRYVICPPLWIPNQVERKTIKQLIEKYIKLKGNIEKKINCFIDQHFTGKRIVGIHLRGSDKYHEVGYVDHRRMLEFAQNFKNDESKFFVATDEERLLVLAKTILGDDILFYDSHRSTNGAAVHYNNIQSLRPLLGEEVLIEALLLSKCDYFIHSLSNVSSCVLVFNPDLEHRLFR